MPAKKEPNEVIYVDPAQWKSYPFLRGFFKQIQQSRFYEKGQRVYGWEANKLYLVHNPNMNKPVHICLTQPIIEIDPRDGKYFSYLRRFFFDAQAKGAGGWNTTEPYAAVHEEKPIFFRFTHSVVCRKNKRGGYVYEVIDKKPLGSGGYCRVYPILKTFEFKQISWKEDGKDQPGYLVFKPKSVDTRRIVKEFGPRKNKELGAFRAKDLAERDYKLMLNTPHSHPKETIQINDNLYLICRRMEGMELFSILEKDRADEPMTLKKRFQLSELVLQALKSQVIDCHLVHRDIKPENIMVDLEREKVNIIDYNLSKKENEYRSEIVGTPSYISPEVFHRQQATGESDIYSMGRVLALIWRCSFASYAGDERYVVFTKLRSQDLFLGLKKLPDHEKDEIKDLCAAAKVKIKAILRQMLEVEPDNRPSIEKCIESFQEAQKIQFQPEEKAPKSQEKDLMYRLRLMGTAYPTYLQAGNEARQVILPV